jgi:SAM-dependent methyltransferase
MPDAETLEQIYGNSSNYAQYLQCNGEGEKLDYENGPVVRWLKSLSRGTFLDYGCGHGNLLLEAVKLGWKSIGVEYNQEFADLLRNIRGVEIFTADNVSNLEYSVDVLCLGDVLEHLTDINTQFQGILRLLKPNGILLAQGPLDANFNLFFLILKWARTFYKGKNNEIQPQHVIMATRKGQMALFERFGLIRQEFTIYEEWHPAPSEICGRQFLQPRTLGMYSLRKLSRAISSLRTNEWGNRYFYAGIKS